MKTVNQIKMIVCLAMLTLVAAMTLTACGSAQAAPDPSATPAAAATPKTASTPPRAASSPGAPSPTAAKAIPKLNDISFTLALDPQQEFTENTTPIYLQTSQILHLSWVVLKGGDHFYMTFTQPSGNSIAIRADGSLSAYTPGETPEKLYKNGDVVFRPSDNDWQEGYYLFHAQIFQGDPTVSVKLLYWIE